jgi:hypothetical protein
MKIVLQISKYIALTLCGLIIIGCATKKELVSFSETNTFFNVVGYAKSAPFSPDPNLYCFMKIEPEGFISNQIDNILVFQTKESGLHVVYKTVDQDHILINNTNSFRKKLLAFGDFYQFDKRVVNLYEFKIKIIDRLISINKVECILINWHSGGIYIYSFKNFFDGVSGSFNMEAQGKLDKRNSGHVIFTDWNKRNEDWPEIKKFQFPLTD